MAVTPTQYATASEYRNAVDMTTTSQDSEIDNVLTAISRGIDNELGRFFGRDDSATTRVYLPGENAVVRDHLTVLHVDDISTGDDFEIKLDEDDDGSFSDETKLAADDTELLPFNADKDPEPRPFTMIRMTPWGDTGSFALGQRVQVTARFGWPSVPQPIKEATIQLAAIWRLESARATQRVPELGEATQASPEAQMIVLRLREKYGRAQYV